MNSMSGVDMLREAASPFSSMSTSESGHRAQVAQMVDTCLTHMNDCERRMDEPLDSVSAVVELYQVQRSYVQVCVSLVELLQCELRQAQAQSRKLPEMHSILTRCYIHGIHMPVEKLLHILSEAPHGTPAANYPAEQGVLEWASYIIQGDFLERMLTDTYAICSYLYERAIEWRVRRACVEWLGEVARRMLTYLHTLQHLKLPRYFLADESDSWLTVASRWYGMAASETPDKGRLYAALGDLSISAPLLSLYLYAKCLQVVQPCLAARESMLECVSRSAQLAQNVSSPCSHDLFVKLIGSLLQPDADLSEFGVRLEKLRDSLQIAPCPLLETEWAEMAMCSTAALLEFMREEAWIPGHQLMAYHIPSDARPFGTASSAVVASFTQRSASYVPEPPSPARFLTAAREEGLPLRITNALAMILVLLSSGLYHLQYALSDPASHINSPGMYITIMLGFLQVLSLRQSVEPVALVCRVIRKFLPWDRLAVYAHGDVFGTGSADAETLLDWARMDLPEDWCLRGVSWNACTPPCTRSVPPEESSAFAFPSETSMLSDLGAISRHFASLTTRAYRAAYVHDPDLQRLLRARHARTAVLYACLESQFGLHKDNALHE
ncbi:hypothetical protein Malapachy_2349 [Malassezia pachydermatis]|uniref:Uncharacterized protein n=1 Tax=Malassezia pachydermatis TaxID=77020 RepID=A0A0M8MXY0_9BASI|nr:hypothetical protein Malapachy_2349 [Malassezia pachydermatis]KOS15791.1 hypothetical protein Malapachy_2349 [Malassezia pachydermatis]